MFSAQKIPTLNTRQPTETSLPLSRWQSSENARLRTNTLYRSRLLRAVHGKPFFFDLLTRLKVEMDGKAIVSRFDVLIETVRHIEARYGKFEAEDICESCTRHPTRRHRSDGNVGI
jgi:hypothetical protein